jgi:alpha-N-arabinofuranosidase
MHTLESAFRLVVLRSSIILAAALCLTWRSDLPRAAQAPEIQGSIQVDAQDVTGQVPHYLFGQFIEHEHNTIDDGLLAQLLHDRKFEEGDRDGVGVSAGWVPEERITARYWELRNGRGVKDRYYIDHDIYYGGGASQAIEISGDGSNHASVYQIGLQFAKGKAYSFYVYLRKRGTGKGFVEIDSGTGKFFAETEKPKLSAYLHKDFELAGDDWEKYTADFTAPENTSEGRVRIGFTGEGTFWMDSASLMPSDNIDGVRRDVLEALRPIHISVLRYPGGCYADYYDWKDGIGPRDKRPDKWSTVWHEWNSNDFGTDEYMELARTLGYDGHITTNYISGTPEDAAEWVEYTNGSAQTPMGRRRAQNGHPEPYGIKLWAIGNEAPNLCSEEYTGGVKMADYADRFRAFQGAMLRVDPSLQFMASSVGNPEWIHGLLQALPAEKLPISIYTGQMERGGAEAICDQQKFYHGAVAEPLQFRDRLDANIKAAGGRLPSHPFFAITEFNSWWLPETHDPEYRLANALYFGGVFNELLRHANRIFLAENCSLINVQGIIEVNPVAVKLTPPYYAYILYANHTGSEVLKTETAVPPVSFGLKPPALDAVATRSSDGHTLFLAVVNRAQNAAVSAQITLKGWRLQGPEAKVYELTGKSWDAFNPYGSTKNVNISRRTAKAAQTPFAYLFPAHTVTVLELGGR